MIRKHRFESHALDKDDEGYGTVDFGKGLRVQDDAFVEAMRKAIQKGKEKAPEGIKVVQPGEAHVLRSPIRPATYVPSASSLENA